MFHGMCKCKCKGELRWKGECLPMCVYVCVRKVKRGGRKKTENLGKEAEDKGFGLFTIQKMTTKGLPGMVGDGGAQNTLVDSF